MIDTKALIYSLDKTLGLWEIKSWDFEVSKYDIIPLQGRIQDQQINAHILWEDAHYKFGQIVSAPYIMYSQGKIDLLDRDIIAIVWPRKASAYQQQVVEDFMLTLRDYDVVTISWWAPGIDTLCHTLSMQYDIPTIMVLWGWFDTYLRSRSRTLMSQIVERWWCILSEFRIWQAKTNRTYPQRNRIIAGLAETVFLPWATQSSGSLITVDFARQMHKPIYTVPASIYEVMNQGTNNYISQGLVHATHDFSAFLGKYFTKKSNIQQTKLNIRPKQQKIIDLIGDLWSSSIEEVASRLDIQVGCILSELNKLEVEWLVYESWVWRRSLSITK